MNYTAKLIGEINSMPIDVVGEGTISEGITQGNYKLINVPINFNLLILQGMLITGYPNACKSVDDSINVFKGKSYRYTRRLLFNNGDKIEMTADCKIEGEYLDSTFTVSGMIESPDLLYSEPITEIWQPAPNNTLSGLFRISWKTSGGGFLSADAHSLYSPGRIISDQRVLHRYIEISASVSENSLSLHQDSKLFKRLNMG